MSAGREKEEEEEEGAPLAALPLEGEEDVMAEVEATRARPRSLLIGQAGPSRHRPRPLWAQSTLMM